MRFSFRQLDRRVVYLLVFLALATPLVFGLRIKPARLHAAEKFFEIVENLPNDKGGIALLAFDYGPSLRAENQPQSEVILEHLMRRRIPVVLFSLYVQAEPFLTLTPERIAQRLMAEYPGERWSYGKDWVNAGFRPGGFLVAQGLARAKNLAEYFGQDVQGSRLSDLPLFASPKSLEQVLLFANFTGLQGQFDIYLSFLKKEGFRPPFGLGCTSISIPESYIYLDSGQLNGLLEGIAGAAWYSELLSARFPGRAADDAVILNTGLGVAHLVIILLVILGNVAMLIQRPVQRSRSTS